MANLGYIPHGGGHHGGGHGGHGGHGGGRGWGGGIVPIVYNDRMVEEIDLQPYGNTIVVETASDNPFEDDLPVEVFTQMSGGMAGPDPKQTSRARVIAKKPGAKVPQLMPKGRAPAVRFAASAHKAHTGFMPGIAGIGDLGATAPMVAPAATTTPPAGPTTIETITGILNPLTQAGSQIVGQYYGTKTAEQQAEIARQQAAAAAAAQQAAQLSLQQSGILANMNKNKWLTYGLLAAAGLALLTAVGLKIAKSRRR